MLFESTLYFAGLIGCAVFAISGGLAAAEKRQDIMSFILLGVVTGLGGGTVRDLVLNKPAIFWLAEPLYLYVCVAAAALTYFLAPILASKHRALIWMDAAGMALFSVTAAHSTLQWHDAWLVAMAMAMITASFGGVMRDVLLDQMPVILEPEIYVSASLLGALTYLIANAMALPTHWAIAIGVLAAFSLRGAAIIWDLRLPKYKD
ncbi:trimeric intracellular cation channel family protein [Simiduia sp. 21SJ11W-1]|uniref:trimeric intracellular cation channel family protein n=1 Tax=Simiduia sp. 21SJ11W-1 TaxID=2909669 RepID=UPI00209FBFFF|nr:trimeric intracellular cation channel family protein [Simiduia sp. 21SJ11W-1]UTA48812.1 trimeric intracellular cation channel family protein [Simiduia sp. 21SJ11W-1]